MLRPPVRCRQFLLSALSLAPPREKGAFRVGAENKMIFPDIVQDFYLSTLKN
jgi:hypothetical protein